MSEQNESLDTQRARYAVQQRLAEAKSAGHWYPWAALGIAAVWWAAGGFAAQAYLNTAAGVSAPLIAAILLGAAVPGFLIVVAGFMARESVRSFSANAVVLDAAQSLLTPSAQLSSDAKLFASEMADSAALVDKSMGHALSAMKAMAGEIGDERLRLESVAYASADNARDLSERLSTERAAMEELARELKIQTETIADTIPRQAEMIIEAARKTSEEVTKVDSELETRLQDMDGIGNTLGSKLVDLDRIAKEASQRAETLNYAVSRIEEKLEQSRKTVESAVRAGELAAAAAGTTGDALKDAVSSALTDAREATEDIQLKTRAAAEDMARTLAALRQQCADTVGAMRLTSTAAANETVRRERETGIAAEAAPAPRIAKTEPARAPEPRRAAPRPEPAPLAQEDEILELAPEPLNLTGKAPESQGHQDDDLFESGGEANAMALRNRIDTEDPEPVIHNGNGQSNGGDSDWNDILSDLDDAEDAPPTPTLAEDREEAAEQLINHLQTSGIRLPDTFKPKDKRKIAEAAQQGDEQRRSVTMDIAKRQVERVSKRLQADQTLHSLARVFVAVEQTDALSALEQTSKSGRNASPRLSAFLLVDAALAGDQIAQS